MNEKRFNIRKSHVMKNGWFIEDSLKKFTFPTSKGDKGWLTSYCKALNKLFEDKEQLKKLLECSREEANDYCEELMGKDEFIRLYKSQRDDAIKENEKVLQLLDDKISFLYGKQGDMINDDDYRYLQISFAIDCLRELKKELQE